MFIVIVADLLSRNVESSLVSVLGSSCCNNINLSPLCLTLSKVLETSRRTALQCFLSASDWTISSYVMAIAVCSS